MKWEHVKDVQDSITVITRVVSHITVCYTVDGSPNVVADFEVGENGLPANNSRGYPQQSMGNKVSTTPKAVTLVTPSQSSAKNSKNEISPLPNNLKTSTVRLHVEFVGSLKELAGPFKEWRVASAATAQNIFKIQSLKINDSTPHGNEVTSPDLSKGIITKIGVLAYKNELPYSVSIDFTGQASKSNCFTLDGQQGAIMMFGDTSHAFSKKQEIFVASDLLNDYLLNKYGHLSRADILSDITVVKASGHYLVPLNSVILTLLQKNRDRFGFDSSAFPKTPDNMHVQVPKESFDKILDDFDQTILQKFNFTDLSQFTAQLKRTNGMNLDDISESKIKNLSGSDLEDEMDKVRTVGCTLEIEWTYPRPAQDKENLPNKTTGKTTNTNVPIVNVRQPTGNRSVV